MERTENTVLFNGIDCLPLPSAGPSNDPIKECSANYNASCAALEDASGLSSCNASLVQELLNRPEITDVSMDANETLLTITMADGSMLPGLLITSESLEEFQAQYDAAVEVDLEAARTAVMERLEQRVQRALSEGNLLILKSGYGGGITFPNTRAQEVLEELLAISRSEASDAIKLERYTRVVKLPSVAHQLLVNLSD